MQKITPFLWFDTQAEEAAEFYVAIFKNSRILGISRYGEAGPGPKGSVMTVRFVLDGQEFIVERWTAFQITEAVSFSVDCRSQEEVDEFWGEALGRRRTKPVRMAQRQIRLIVADQPDGPVSDAQRSGSSEIETGRGSNAASEEIYIAGLQKAYDQR